VRRYTVVRGATRALGRTSTRFFILRIVSVALMNLL
jgi:hypothetical protein